MKTAGRSPLKPECKPELLAPAGDFEALKAAVSQGADAVYFGSGSFNARRNAANFAGSLLHEAIDYAHWAGARAYLTLNTLIADKEGSAALELAGQAYAAGIDALIVHPDDNNRRRGAACRSPTGYPAGHPAARAIASRDNPTHCDSLRTGAGDRGIHPRRSLYRLFRSVPAQQPDRQLWRYCRWPQR